MTNLDNEIIEHCKRHKTAGNKNFYLSIAELINQQYNTSYSPEDIRCISRRYRKKNGLDENFQSLNQPSKSSKECTNSFSEKEIVVPEGTLLTDDILLEQHGYDPKCFSVVEVRTSQWETHGGEQRCSSRIKVKPKNSFRWTQNVIDKIFADLDVPRDRLIFPEQAQTHNGLLLVLPIVDLHWALKASVDYSNNEYNEKKAYDCLVWTVCNIISRVRGKEIKKIFFTIGNDILNCDNILGGTTRGTPQENCVCIENAVIEVTNTLIDCINMLREIAPVEVIHIPSNHDYLMGLGVANAIRAHYMESKDVDVDASYKERKYRRWGTNLLGFAHDLKVQNVNNIIVSDAREHLSETCKTIYFLGHLHHEECMDVCGTDVRRLPKMGGFSRWEYNQGYNSIRKCQSFVIDEYNGITDVLYTFLY